MSSIHEEKEAFKCKVCGKPFSQKAMMIKHMSSIHEGKKPFKCKVCENSFSQKSSFSSRRHMESIHKGDLAFSKVTYEF